MLPRQKHAPQRSHLNSSGGRMQLTIGQPCIVTPKNSLELTKQNKNMKPQHSTPAEKSKYYTKAERHLTNCVRKETAVMPGKPLCLFMWNPRYITLCIAWGLFLTKTQFQWIFLFLTISVLITMNFISLIQLKAYFNVEYE